MTTNHSHPNSLEYDLIVDGIYIATNQFSLANLCDELNKNGFKTFFNKGIRPTRMHDLLANFIWVWLAGERKKFEEFMNRLFHRNFFTGCRMF